MNTFDNIEKLGRQAWLTGLGAYGTGLKYAAETFDKTFDNTNRLVGELIVEGQKIEDGLREKLKAKKLLDTKITALKNKLGLRDSSKLEKLEKLEVAVDELTVAVSQLIADRQKKGATKPVSKATSKTKVAKKKSDS